MFSFIPRFQLDEGVRLEDLVHHFPAHMSGADIYSICSKAWTLAIRRIINTCPDQKTVTVTMEDFEGACPPQSVPEKTSPFQFAPDSPLLSPGSSANVAPEVMVSWVSQPLVVHIGGCIIIAYLEVWGLSKISTMFRELQYLIHCSLPGHCRNRQRLATMFRQSRIYFKIKHT